MIKNKITPVKIQKLSSSPHWDTCHAKNRGISR